MSAPSSIPAPQSAAAARPISVSAQAFAAILLGMLVVGIAGFSHLEVVHNAAHDTRHSSAFPCH